MEDEAYEKCPSWFNSQIYSVDRLQDSLYYLRPIMNKLESKASMLGSFSVKFIRSKKRIDEHSLVLEYKATIEGSDEVRFIHLEFLPRGGLIYWFGRVTEEEATCGKYSVNGKTIFSPHVANIHDLEKIVEEYLKLFPKEYF